MKKFELMGAAICVVAMSAGTLMAEPGGTDGGASCRVPKLEASFVSSVEMPESIATDHRGNLYISEGNTLRKRTSDGTMSLFATLPLPIYALGVKVGPDGCVYTASTSLSDVPGAFVWRVCSPNSVEVFAELDHSGAPNDLAFDSKGHLYVTDPVLGRVWKVSSSGRPEVFVQHPLLGGTPESPALSFRALGVNGIALDEHEQYLYLSNTDQGSIVRVRLHSLEHTPSVFVQAPLLRGADGIAFDRRGTLLVAVNASDSLVSVSEERKLHLVSQGGLLDGPSSMAFGATFRDRHQLYVISGAFLRTLGFASGTPGPALLTACVGTPGLGLPIPHQRLSIHRILE